jgi:hypothetical protein
MGGRQRNCGSAGATALLFALLFHSRTSQGAETAAAAATGTASVPPPAGAAAQSAQASPSGPPDAPSAPSAAGAPVAPAGTPLPPIPVPGAAPSPQAAPAAASPPLGAPPFFGSDPVGAVAAASDLAIKMYGDTGFAIRNNANQPWPTSTSNPDVYAPGVWNSFFAPRLDIFCSADVGNLSFLTEVMFEASQNNFTEDLERMQLNYLFFNWLRLTVGRSHTAWGYYNDSYHHGNIFELTTSRPFGVNFEDSFGLIQSHNVGVGLDGTIDAGGAGAFRYDVEVGNSRPADITGVAMQYAEVTPKNVNVRLRWMPLDGLILGVNGMRGIIPALGGGAGPLRPQTEELVAGAHVVYTEHHMLVDIEGFAMRHNPDGLSSTSIYGGFAELGYAIGAFTPYLRPEYLAFPSQGDIVYQYGPSDAQGLLNGYPSIYYGVKDFVDLRVGVKWLPVPQLAVKLEGQRLSRDSQQQEIATVKVAFGF